MECVHVHVHVREIIVLSESEIQGQNALIENCISVGNEAL